MATSFPLNPTVGQIFTVGVKSWKWNGAAWDNQAITDTQVASALDAATRAENAAAVIGTAAAFLDSNPIAKSAGDATKQFKVDLSGLPTGTTGTLRVEKSGTPLLTVDVDKTRAYYDQSNNTNTLDYRVAGYQRWSPGATGTQTLSITNWPAPPVVGKLILDVINGGAGQTLGWPSGTVFVTAGGLEVSTLAQSGITFPASGRRRLLVWSVDGGTTVFVKGA